MNNYSIEKNAIFTCSRFEGSIQLPTVNSVVGKITHIAQQTPKQYTFVLDCSQANLNALSEYEAKKVAIRCELTLKNNQNKLFVGIFPNPRDYALACMWAAKLCLTHKFETSQLYLFNSPIEAWKFVRDHHAGQMSL